MANIILTSTRRPQRQGVSALVTFSYYLLCIGLMFTLMTWLWPRHFEPMNVQMFVVLDGVCLVLLALLQWERLLVGGSLVLLFLIGWVRDLIDMASKKTCNDLYRAESLPNATVVGFALTQGVMCIGIGAMALGAWRFDWAWYNVASPIGIMLAVWAVFYYQRYFAH